MEQVTQLKNYPQSKPFDILVTGATGFIGARLVKELSNRGYTVRGMTRKQLQDNGNVKYIQADALDAESLTHALEGVEIAYYLLHSMEGDKKNWKEFATREKTQAENFLKAASKNGVKRIIYLGGLVNESLDLSPHMQSRKQVGEILASGNIPVTELRASLIIGAQGGSYAMLRYLVERLGVMVCPKWVKSKAQPIAVDDVISYLVGCMEHSQTSGKIYDIGGADIMNYEQIMRVYAKYLNRKIFIMEIPFLTTKLSSYWVDLITPVKASLARPLIDSLVHDTVVKDDSITKIIPMKLKGVLEAIDIATKDIEKNPPKELVKESRTSFVVNQRILICALFAMAIIGTTYYWLDDRPEVYQIGWLFGSLVWYVGIISAIIFVWNKTRLGYFIAGVLSWITIAFWMFDNYHVLFTTSIIAQEPSAEITIRNFVGVIITAFVIASSHNVFHKVQQYQAKGRPI